MEYPYATEIPVSRDIVDTFGGLNHTANTGRGEMYDMTNMTSDEYPHLSTRKARGTAWSDADTRLAFGEEGYIVGMFWKDGLWVCGTDGNNVSIIPPDGIVHSTPPVVRRRIETDLDDSPKQFVQMGAYVIILPDKKFLDTAGIGVGRSQTITRDIEVHNDVTVELYDDESGYITFSPVTGDGEELSYDYKQDSVPQNPTNQQLWLDTSSKPHSLKQFVESTGMWVSVATSYIKIELHGSTQSLTDGISKDDTVYLQNVPVTSPALMTIEDGDFYVHDVGENYIIVTGLCDEVVDSRRADTQGWQNIPMGGTRYTMTVKREMPIMDYVTESGNRLWGCRYGRNAKGEFVNEIYASKLGDFKNWRQFQGISTDSYIVSLGADGAFTGAVTYGGYPTFFRERTLHKVYGTMPSNFQMITQECKGVAKGCGDSLAIVNEVLYYKGKNGVCAYDGSVPVECGTALGEMRFYEAMGAAKGSKYYLAIDGTVYVYDTGKGMWHKEDKQHISCMASSGDECYMLIGNTVRTVSPDSTREQVEWMVESGIIGFETPSGYGVAKLVDHKYVSRLLVRLSLAFGTRVFFLISYDSSGEWEHIGTLDGTVTRSFSIPIRPRRCDHFRIRIMGDGMCKIFGISKTLEQGGDLG